MALAFLVDIIILMMSIWNVKEKVEYYVVSVQMRRPLKWNRACCRNISENSILVPFSHTLLFSNLPPDKAIGRRWKTSSLASLNSSKINFLQGYEIFKRRPNEILMFGNPSVIGTEQVPKQTQNTTTK
jgi:hypothetical protein